MLAEWCFWAWYQGHLSRWCEADVLKVWQNDQARRRSR
jgi:hypothetical protein